MQGKAFTAGIGGGGGGGSSYTDITQIYERNQEATVYVGNLDTKVDEDLLCELFTQCGPVKNVHMPRDKITSTHSNYGFVEYESELDADYAIKILNMIKLYGKPIRCNKASQDKRTQEVGANLFVGNLDADVDEKLLYDTFSAFGPILSAKVMRDPETGESKGYGFVSYDSFESSDACLVGMNGQFLCNRPVHVSYAYKKDTKGERHGSAAERFIAANRPNDRLKPNLPNFPNVLPNAPVNLPNLPNMPNLQGFPNLPNIPPPPMLGGMSGQGQHGGPSPSSSGPGGGEPPHASSMPPPGNIMSPGRPLRPLDMNSNMSPNNFPPFGNMPPGGGGERGAGGMIPGGPPPSGMNKNMPPFMPGMPPLPNMGGRMPPPFGGGGGLPGMPPVVPPPLFFPVRPGMGLPPGMPPLPNPNFGGGGMGLPMQNTRNQ